MESIIYTHLKSKLKTRKVSTDEHARKFQLSIRNHTLKLYTQAAKKKDIAMLNMLERELSDGIYNFVREIKMDWSRLAFRDRTVESLKQCLLNPSYDGSADEARFNFFRENIPWMTDYAEVFGKVIVFNQFIHPDYFDPEKLTAEGLKALLLSKIEYGAAYKKEEFISKLPGHILDNQFLLFFSDLRKSESSLSRHGGFFRYLKEQGVKISTESFDRALLLNGSITNNNLKENVALIEEPNNYVLNHGELLNRIEAVTSLKELLFVTQLFCSGLPYTPHTDSVKLDYDTEEAKIKHANSEFVLYRKIAEKLDTYSGAMLKNSDKFNLEMAKKVFESLCSFYSYRASSKLGENHRLNRFNIATAHYEFKYLPKLVASLLSYFDDDYRVTAIHKAGSEFPVSVLSGVVAEKKLDIKESVMLAGERCFLNTDTDSLSIDCYASLFGELILQDPSALSFRIHLSEVAKESYLHGIYSESGTVTLRDAMEKKVSIAQFNRTAEEAVKYCHKKMAQLVNDIPSNLAIHEKPDLTYLTPGVV